MTDVLLKKNIIGVVKLAIMSRILYMAIAYTTYLLIPPYDKSIELISTKSWLKFLLAWDAVHFFEIMKNGYLKTHETAFFPLLPYISRYIGKILFLDPFTVGVLVSCTAFVISSALLYKISFTRYGHRIAKMSCVLFMFNPASIVYTSMYSESLFMLLFLVGFHFIENNNMFHGTLLMSLCGLCRSNGILFMLMLIFPLNRYVLVRLPLILAPFALFQYYCLLTINRARDTFSIFIPYSYVQKIYWGQGPFKFYKFDPANIQNMFVGLPFILMSFYILYAYWGKKQAMRYVKDIYMDKSRLETTSLNTNICAILLAIQTLITILIIHWNMYFRFISFNPVIYWVLAIEYYSIRNRFFRWIMFRYFFGFGIVYAMLFGCFYPPC